MGPSGYISGHFDIGSQVNSTEATTLSRAASWYGKERSTCSHISGNRGYVSTALHRTASLDANGEPIQSRRAM